MGTHLVKAEGITEEISLFFDKIFNRAVKTQCDFCGKTMNLHKTIYNKTKGKQSYPENCANIMLRH